VAGSEVIVATVSELISGLDHQTTRCPGLMVVRFIKALSCVQVAATTTNNQMPATVSAIAAIGQARARY
jgi:hypothetical protein